MREHAACWECERSAQWQPEILGPCNHNADGRRIRVRRLADATEFVDALGIAKLLGGPIVVWRFRDAPAVLQAVSTNGGDEDWLAVVPPALVGEWVGWLDSEKFGCSAVDGHRLSNGAEVVIGSHS